MEVWNEEMGDSLISSQDLDSHSASWISTPDQFNLGEALNNLPSLGLRLSRTPSFLYKLDQLVQGHNSNDEDQTNYGLARLRSKDLQNPNKMKAENFPISILKIGSWQRVSRNEGDLVAKCYFAKKKLVWEFLENGLKSKIETQWCDILSLKAVMQEDQPGILEIELGQIPSFYHEIDPQPRKHTQWKVVTDFTGGQALTFRRHYLEFPPGALDRPLDKLLGDSRLYQLSRQAFPTLESPYFHRHSSYGIDMSFESGRQGPLVNPNPHQFSFSNVPNSHFVSQHYHTYDQTTSNSLSAKDSESPLSDEKINNNQMALWGHQGMNNVRDSLVTTQVGGGLAYAKASTVSQVNSTISPQNNHMSTISPQNNHMSTYLQEATRNQLEGLVFTPPMSQLHPTPLSHAPRFQTHELQNMMGSNSPIEFTNQVVGGNFSMEGFNYACNTVTTNYGQEMVDNNSIVVMNNWSNSDGRQIYPQHHASWLQTQVFQDNMSMNVLQGNNVTYYPSVVSDPSIEYFPSDQNFNELNDWAWKSG